MIEGIAPGGGHRAPQSEHVIQEEGELARDLVMPTGHGESDVLQRICNGSAPD